MADLALRGKSCDLKLMQLKMSRYKTNENFSDHWCLYNTFIYLSDEIKAKIISQV